MTLYYSDDTVSLHFGDCREIISDLPLASVDLLMTDPPYAAAAATVTTGFGKAKWGGNWGDMSLVTLMTENILDRPQLTPSHQVLWFCDHLSYAALVPSFFRRYTTVQNVIWDKDMLGVGAHFRKQTELILYARTEQSPSFMRKDMRDLVRIRPNYATKQHPAEKPLALIEHFAEALTWTTVLDPFAGSGTTLLAAKRLGRKAVGIEIEERYCEVIATRLAQGALDFGEAS